MSAARAPLLSELIDASNQFDLRRGGYGKPAFTAAELAALETMSCASENMLCSLVDGLGAVGDLLARYGDDSDAGMDNDVVRSAGFLIEQIADQIETLRKVNSNADYFRHKGPIRERSR